MYNDEVAPIGVKLRLKLERSGRYGVLELQLELELE